MWPQHRLYSIDERLDHLDVKLSQYVDGVTDDDKFCKDTVTAQQYIHEGQKPNDEDLFVQTSRQLEQNKRSKKKLMEPARAALGAEHRAAPS